MFYDTAKTIIEIATDKGAYSYTINVTHLIAFSLHNIMVCAM